MTDNEQTDRGHAAISTARKASRGRNLVLAFAFLVVAVVPSGTIYLFSLRPLQHQTHTESVQITGLTQAVTSLSQTLARDEQAVCRAFRVKCPSTAKPHG
jgi:hypothetical protein